MNANEATPSRHKQGVILWPERFDKAFFEDRKRMMGALAFNNEYLNYPIDETTRIFHPKWPHWYTSNELDYDERKRRWVFRDELLEIMIGVDPAISEQDRADYIGLVDLGVARRQGVTVILNASADRLDFSAQVKTIIQQEAIRQPK